MLTLIARLIAAALASAACAGVAVQDGSDYGWDCPGNGYLPYHADRLVGADRLAEWMAEGEVDLVHVDVDDAGRRRVTYDESHLPGARRLRWAELIGAAPGLEPATSRLPLFEAAGVVPGRRVVFYDTGLGREAAAAWTALDALGLADDAALLDGQWTGWAHEGRPLSMSEPPVVPSRLEPRPVDGVVRRAGDAVTWVDARGETRGGRVVGLTWEEHLANPGYPYLKGEEGLRRLWSAVPPRPGWIVGVGAGRWWEAAPVYFAARLLGYSARVLDGDLAGFEGARPD